MGGKSATGRKRKHYYYSHTKGNSLFTEAGEKCRLHRIRAERTEDIILNAIQKKITNPQIINQMIKDYEQSSTKKTPKVQGQLLSVEKEIKSLDRKLENLSIRLSEVLHDIPAEPIYEQMRRIKEKREKLMESELFLREELLKRSHLEVDKKRLIENLKTISENLTKSPKERHKEIYTNVIDFIEVHPQKVRLGLYAPAKPVSCVGSTSVSLGADGEI